ncbi:hypothetical protein O0I10_006190 [Lichtheimia ornata]|uniref:Glucosidase 2 subunit beta n=1 Tax=Lichtheimia ornata TaxID=688661 RepID=A0AAD7V3X9_9FUNG|nr:uncharacterized protein O0I10_006190 [Lichtheimia ornata]KAJ8658183.1 hypothetical protein O0I10_006190 [Lichtheimia ornata]
MAPFLQALPCILAAIAVVQASSLRGINPERQHLYQPKNGQWECLDNSKAIPATAINDDYCDCPDGSDEPGTSACPNSMFYCENKGHIPAYIKSWAVDDGVCDEACCDGSDEISGLVQCPNVCDKVAAEHAQIQAALRKIQTEGATAKSKLIQEAEATVRGWEDEKSKLEDNLAIQRAELLRRQQEIDAIEKSAKSSSSKSKGSKKACPPCNAALLSEHIRTLEDEIESLTTILKTMKRDHNHNFHDLAVKAAIGGYDEFIEGYDELKAEIDKDLISEEDYTFENADEEVEEEEVEIDDPVEKAGKVAGMHPWLEKIVAVIPPKWRHFVTQEETKDPVDHKTNPALEAARKAYNDVNNEIQSLERNLQTINDDLGKDYGEKHEWLKLKDTCVEKNEGEYTYSVCLFGNAYQKSNKDGARVNLGRFDQFLGDEHKEQIYNRGTKCWNGPERSVHAKFECGGETEIIEVTEPEKCEYRYRLKTPAVCPLTDELKQEGKGRPVHEEL